MTSLPRTFSLFHASSNFSHLFFLLFKSQGNIQLRYGCIYYPLHMHLAPSVSMPLGHPTVNSTIHTNAAMAGRNDLTVNFQGKSWKGQKTWDPLRPWNQLDFFTQKLQFHINIEFPWHRWHSHSKTKRSRMGSSWPSILGGFLRTGSLRFSELCSLRMWEKQREERHFVQEQKNSR